MGKAAKTLWALGIVLVLGVYITSIIYMNSTIGTEQQRLEQLLTTAQQRKDVLAKTQLDLQLEQVSLKEQLLNETAAIGALTQAQRDQQASQLLAEQQRLIAEQQALAQQAQQAQPAPAPRPTTRAS